MSDEEQRPERPSGPTPRGPAYIYTPFTRPAEAQTPEAAGAEASAVGRPGPRQFRLVAAGAALVLVVLAASAAGATIAHEFWTKPGSASALSGGGVSSSGPTVGGISIGPNGISFGNSGPSGGSAAATGGPANAAAIAAKVDPALVDVTSMFSAQPGVGEGTGIVVSSTGEVLTNNHVIDGATRITATDIGSGKTYEATVVGYDPSHDIAVLQLQGASGLATAKLGDSSKLSVGDPVLGIGNAGGIGGTPTPAGGEITALDQSVTAGDELGGQTERLSGLIQTDAAIQPGDSGGALVDGQGRVVGMITAGTPGSGFGFRFGGSSSGQAYAIPVEQVAKTASQIVAGRGSASVHVGPSAFLGVQVASPAFPGFGGFGSGGGTSGVTIAGVVNGEPAEKAGLTAGAVITSIDGKRVDAASDLSKVMLAHHPGDTVTLGWTSAAGQSQSSSIQLASGPSA